MSGVLVTRVRHKNVISNPKLLMLKHWTHFGKSGVAGGSCQNMSNEFTLEDTFWDVTSSRPVNMFRRLSRARAEPDGTRAETRFRLSPKRTSPFKSAGESVQSTAGSRGVRISVSNAGYSTSRGRVRVLATHSTRQFPLHFPSHASPCAITFRTQYTPYLLKQLTSIATISFSPRTFFHRFTLQDCANGSMRRALCC